jgi:DNA-binding PadR family transcriptional regulator
MPWSYAPTGANMYEAELRGRAKPSADRGGNFRYAVLGLIANRSDGVHGYQLMSDVEALSDDFWQLNYGRLYRVLDWLAEAGDVEFSELFQSGRPNRKVFRITETGVLSLEDWLLRPLSKNPQPLRDELSLKLLFLRHARVDRIAELVTQQRSIYLSKLSLTVRRRRRLQKAGLPMDAIALVMDGAEIRLRADLSWLDHVERTVLRRF